MGSPYTVQIVGTKLTQAHTDTLKADAEDLLKEVNRQMSHYQPDSELSRFNRAPANTPFKVSPEFARGRRLCHIIDPKTGWPVQHNVGGVSVVARDGMTADALATTLFVLGPEAGLRFVESWTNAAALFIEREAEGKFRSVPSSRVASLTGYQP